MTNFDPTYGYTLTGLLQVQAPEQPEGFLEFWQARYRRIIDVPVYYQLIPGQGQTGDFDCFDLFYQSTDDCLIGGWLLVPQNKPIKRGIVIGHGYGGRDSPDPDLPVAESVLLFPCFRGLSRSRCVSIPNEPNHHVLHGIDNRDHYILGGCVDDLWLAVSVLLNLFPEVASHVGYLGTSFGGGMGALALPWDNRLRRAYFELPSFGNHPLRLRLPTWGSAAALQSYFHKNNGIISTLSYYDAATAARHIQVPVLIAAALSDPVVAPPGQFSIYNAIPVEKELFILEQGHADYPEKSEQQLALNSALGLFFDDL